MTSILQSAVRAKLVEAIGTLPPAIRVEVSPRDGRFEVAIKYDGTQVWHVPPIDPDAVLDVLDNEIGHVSDVIHRLATRNLMGAW